MQAFQMMKGVSGYASKLRPHRAHAASLGIEDGTAQLTQAAIAVNRSRHPRPTRLGWQQAATQGTVDRHAQLKLAGHEVDACDLYAEGFNPVLTADAHRDYTDAAVNQRGMEAAIADLQRCDTLIFVYPTWWYSQPAMLKGWMDRVWRPGVTFTVPTKTEAMRPALTNVRLIGVYLGLSNGIFMHEFGHGAMRPLNVHGID